MISLDGMRLNLRSSVFLSSLILAALADTFVVYAVLRPYDLVITDVVLHDGRGGIAARGGIAIRADRIVRVWSGALPLFRPSTRVLVRGNALHLSPGFIDTHSHADQSLGPRSTVRIDNLVEQGVTTAIVGNCGRSVLPVDRVRSNVEQYGANINIATLIGYNSIRSSVMGASIAAAGTEEIHEMCAKIAEGMRQGAIGLSTGMPYFPGRFASSDELVEALRVAADEGGIHASHIRDEGKGVLDAVHEVASLSTLARIPLVISHLKITGPANCSTLPNLLHVIAIERERMEQRLYFDAYPYLASSTDLDLYLPDWFVGAPADERIRMLRSQASRARLKEDVRIRLEDEGFPDLDFISIAASSRRAWNGLSIAQIAHVSPQGHDDMDTQLDSMLDLIGRGGAQAIYRNICAAPMLEVFRRLPVMVGSDSAIRYDGEGTPHPRGWGTFPRVISTLVRRVHALELDQAIQRMTSLPASVYGFRQRGAIAGGYYADIVLFNADEITDTATYGHPFGRPLGIELVLVNGAVVGGRLRASLNKRLPWLANTFAGRFLSRQPVPVVLPEVIREAPVVPAATQRAFDEADINDFGVNRK